MNGNYLNKVLKLGAKHALYREDGKWYHNLTRFPGVLFDKNGYILFENEQKYQSHPDLNRKKALHIINGIESLGHYRKFSPREKVLIEGVLNINTFINTNKGDVEDTVRVIRELDIIFRNRYLADTLKKLYNHTCQLCGAQLIIDTNKSYSEIHHIIALGKPHRGKDTLENMICVCPNCHVLLDFKVIRLELEFLNVKHYISEENIEYHNSLVDNKLNKL